MGMNQQRNGSSSPRRSSRKKACRFCSDAEIQIDYKEARMPRGFITERGKIVPRRISGNCSKHQRQVATAIKRARVIALLPYLAVD